MNKSIKIKAIMFTAVQTALGVDAINTQENAVIAKAKFFKSIKKKVTLDNLERSRQAFITMAIAHYDKLHGMRGRLIREYAKSGEGSLKESEKLRGCTLTFRQLKTNAAVMATRWIKYYEHFLETGEVQKSTKRTGKRKAGGATKTSGKKPNDTVSLNTDTPPATPDTPDTPDTPETPPVTEYAAVTVTAEELIGKKLVEGIETQYERDVVYSHVRHANYALIAKPSKSELLIKNNYKAILDTATASCKIAKKTFGKLERAAKAAKSK
tara:strand:- start:281 stop:1084 length:804 start_codon:yes stop_codon:yes gene_type:complete